MRASNTLILDVEKFMQWSNIKHNKGLIIGYKLATHKSINLFDITINVEGRQMGSDGDEYYDYTLKEFKSVKEFTDKYKDVKSRWTLLGSYKDKSITIHGESDYIYISIEIAPRHYDSITIDELNSITKEMYELVEKLEEESNSAEFKSIFIID